MKLFLISTNDWGYDCYSDFVIAANTEEEVRNVAKQNARDEGKNAWVSATIKEIGLYTGDSKEPTLVLGSFHAG